MGILASQTISFDSLEAERTTFEVKGEGKQSLEDFKGSIESSLCMSMLGSLYCGNKSIDGAYLILIIFTAFPCLCWEQKCLKMLSVGMF